MMERVVAVGVWRHTADRCDFPVWVISRDRDRFATPEPVGSIVYSLYLTQI
jgi:hypothetical protein